MLKLGEKETVLMVVRKHWFLMVGPVMVFITLVVLPAIVLTFLPFFTQEVNQETIKSLINLGLSLFFMLLFLLLFLFWVLYYLDMWVITTSRIIDIEQHGLFSREISEIPLGRVQDVTIEIHGIIEMLLKFGTIRVQTAGEREFFIRGVSHLYEIKETIMHYAHPEITEKTKSMNSNS